jgi:RsiW-degrading membrane proteinase PrsW (M82 family)
MIYLITVALGFAALETGLFLMDPFQHGKIFSGILTGNLRFLGAALVHTLSSGVVGFSLAVTFYRNYTWQFVSLCTGLLLATTLHTLFNFYIMDATGESIALVFFFVWIGVVALFLLFERAKRIRG